MSTNTPNPAYQIPVTPGFSQEPPNLPSQPLPTRKPARRGVPTLLAAGIGVGGLLVGCLAGALIGAGMGDTPAATPGAQPPAATGVAATTAAGKPATTQAAPPPPPAAPTVEDGVWTVGVDIPAGRYRTTAAVPADCYWSITKTGSNGTDIIANDIPGGGRPTVTVKAGQDFTSARCGTWTKVG